jgi:peptide/nickel transport system substrate-binding protein
VRTDHGCPRGLRRGIFSILGIATLILAVACTSGQGGNGSSGGTAATTLTIEGSPTGPITENFNPFDTTGPAWLLGAVGMIYEPLFQYNLAKPGQSYPWLATSEQFSDGDKTLTFQLRHGVTWSDGKPFTSADVAFTFNLLKKYPAINTLGITFTSISTPTPYTVVMHFAAPAYVQLYNIAGDTFIVPEHLWTGVNPVTFANAHPVGTGPYVLSQMNAQGMTLVKNTHYWQPGEPAVDKLEYEVFDSNNSAGAALESGQIDWAGSFVARVQQEFASRDPQHNQYWFVAYRPVYLVLNLTESPFNLLPVREALSISLDRAGVVAAGEYGEQPPATSPTGVVLPEEQSLLSPQYGNLRYTTDLAQARALLKQAGFKEAADGKFTEPDGKPFAFTIIGPTAYTDLMSDDQAIAQQWDALGAQVTVQGESVGTWYDQGLTGDYQVTLSAPGSAQTEDPYAAYNETLNSALSSPVGKSSVGDIEHFESPATNALLNDWANATTAAARQQAMDGIESVMVNQIPVIPLFDNVYFAEWNTSQFTGWPTQRNPYDMPAPAGSFAEVVILHLHPVS